MEAYATGVPVSRSPESNDLERLDIVSEYRIGEWTPHSDGDRGTPRRIMRTFIELRVWNVLHTRLGGGRHGGDDLSTVRDHAG
jgi:hypothetical protein